MGIIDDAGQKPDGGEAIESNYTTHVPVVVPGPLLRNRARLIVRPRVTSNLGTLYGFCMAHHSDRETIVHTRGFSYGLWEDPCRGSSPIQFIALESDTAGSPSPPKDA